MEEQSQGGNQSQMMEIDEQSKQLQKESDSEMTAVKN